MNYCKNCDKGFTSYKSFWLHIKRFHKKPINKNICIYCSNKYSTKSNLNRHEKQCKEKYKDINEIINKPIKYNLSNKLDNEYLDNQLNNNDNIQLNSNTSNQLNNNITSNEYQNMIKILVNQLENNSITQNKNSKYANSHNTENNTNSHNTENNAYSHNTNNTNAHNNNTQIINIVPLGNENVIDTLTAQEQINILKQKNRALEAIIKTVHFNKKYPQFQNIAIDNESNGYKYDKMLKRFKEIPKDELLMDLIESRINDIYDLNEENKQYISQKTHKYINSYIDMFNLDHVINQNMNIIESRIMSESQPLLSNNKIKLKIKNK
jgi:hypothetical protein